MHRAFSFRSASRFVASRAARSLFAGVVVLSIAPSLLARSAGAQGAPSEQAVIEYRQLLMSAVGYNMGAIGGILKNQLVLPGHVANHAQQMADAAKLVAPAFKQKVSAGKTDARPEIWQDWAKFEKAIGDYEKAASDLARIAQGSDPAATGAAVKALGDSCTGCHDSFRKPKEQSYKNQ